MHRASRFRLAILRIADDPPGARTHTSPNAVWGQYQRHADCMAMKIGIVKFIADRDEPFRAPPDLLAQSVRHIRARDDCPAKRGRTSNRALR